MTSPLLIPCPPALLRAGLPGHLTRWGGGEIVGVYLGPTEACAYCGGWGCVHDGPAHVPGGYWSTAYPKTFSGPVPHAAVDVDLRDGAVRDHALRVLYAKVRPEEPEPVSAPRWGEECSSPGVWFVGGRRNHFASPKYAGPTWNPSQTTIPALASVPLDSPDRDLLALACVIAAVLGSANG